MYSPRLYWTVYTHSTLHTFGSVNFTHTLLVQTHTQMKFPPPDLIVFICSVCCASLALPICRLWAAWSSTTVLSECRLWTVCSRWTGPFVGRFWAIGSVCRLSSFFLKYIYFYFNFLYITSWRARCCPW